MEFKPKDWVLVRDDEEEKWKLDIFSYKIDNIYQCVGNWYSHCIPYEGNEALLGTTDAPEEKKTDGWKVGDKVEVEYDSDKKWYDGKIVRIDPSHTNWFDDEKMPYYVRSGCFKYNDGCAWCAARQLRNPGEKPEEEFKFGDKVEWRGSDGEWKKGRFILDDGSCIPFMIYDPEDNDTFYVNKEDVRRA